jgi:tRNA(fMet)-specific endonuclease VapC
MAGMTHYMLDTNIVSHLIRGNAEVAKRVDTLPWDITVAEAYGDVRNRLEQLGRGLGSLDMMIAAHALRTESVLVTSDKAFGAVAGLHIQDWTKA